MIEYDPNDPDVKYRDAALPTFEDTNKSYLQFLEGRGAGKINAFSAEGQAIQAQYLAELGDNQHPLDVLRKISLNPFAAAKDRIAASKALLEYTMLKAPSKVEISGPEGQAIKIDQAQLSALSDKDLELLTMLLEKAQGAKG